MKRLLAAGIALGMAFMAVATAPAAAVPTEVTVRVLAKGAKFVGTSMGGVRVTLRDADTGELLASGVTAGSTGDTKRIMVEPHEPGAPYSTEGSAAYTAVLDLTRPRLIEVSAMGPLGQRQAANRVSATQWVIPGKPLTGGDGFLLRLPGFAVDVLDPPSHHRFKGAPVEVKLRANVTMMCGCPVTPGGLWDADKFEVAALLMKDGKQVGTMPLEYAGSASQFEGTWKVGAPGVYEAVVYAYDPADGNTGLDRTTFMVTE
jgi:hypothetical protein